MGKKLWEDEDAGDDFAAVKDSWDDDDDVKPGKETAATAASTKPPATKGKKSQANAKAKAEAADATPSETSTSNAAAEIAQKQPDDNEPIEKFVPKSEKEFAEYAERIAKDLLRPYEVFAFSSHILVREIIARRIWGLMFGCFFLRFRKATITLVL